MKRGHLYDEFVAQFPNTEETARMLASGVIREIETRRTLE
jgi:hypothetical protein